MQYSNNKVFNYREEELLTDEELLFLVKYMKDHYKMTQTETIEEIFNNY
jgi:hypothetical protein